MPAQMRACNELGLRYHTPTVQSVSQTVHGLTLVLSNICLCYLVCIHKVTDCSCVL